MAFDVKKIYPNDLRPRVAIGVDIPFNGKGVFTPNFQTKNAIRNNLINFFLTNPGERFGNPTFGGGLRKFIFEQITEDNLDYLKEDIQQKLSRNFSNVIIYQLNITPNTETHSINVNFSYKVVNTNITDEIDLNFS